jgi:Peptidase family M28
MKRAHLVSLRVGVLALAVLAAGIAQPWRLLAQGPEPAKGVKFAQVSEGELREWLTYLASDELQGRAIFTEGYGNAAQYIADRLKDWGVKPIGDDLGGGRKSYFQTVRLRDYQVTRNSSVTVQVGAESRTFKHGEGVTFGANSGGPQTLSFNSVYFAGYGSQADLADKPIKDQIVVTIPNSAPAGGGAGGRGGVGRGGGAYAINTLGAKAAVGYVAPPPLPSPAEDALGQAQAALTQAIAAVTQAQQAVRGGRAGGGGAGRGAAAATGCTPPACDIRTVQRVDGPVPPQFTASDAFYEFLFSGGPVSFADIKAKAQRGEPLTGLVVPAKVTISVTNTFTVVGEQVSKNVVGLVEGTDPRLKDTYVTFGAHLDHVGYSGAGRSSQPGPNGCRRRSEPAVAAVIAAGKTVQNPVVGRGAAGGAGRGVVATPPALPPFGQRDLTSNGADDDGSGSVTVMALAKAFATGPKAKRSTVFIWHTGEESGLYGSRYNADFPVVPLDKVQVNVNMDMVGRDDCNNLEGDFSNTLFIVGADRISTDLHNLIVQTNATLTKPLTLDYELNDPADPEGVYTRSDHYSYAAKGIPIAFFTTGLHPDYHRVTDTVEKITFPKMARIGQLAYQAGFAIANSEKTLERDNKGPRAGFGTKADVIKK